MNGRVAEYLLRHFVGRKLRPTRRNLDDSTTCDQASPSSA